MYLFVRSQGNISPDTDHVIRVLTEVNTANKVEEDSVQQSYVKLRKVHGNAKQKDVSKNFSLVAYCASGRVQDPVTLETEMKFHHPFAKVRKIVSFDFIGNPWSRGTNLAVKSGTTELFSTACKYSEFPYYPDRRVMTIGADTSPIWAGFMEGAAVSGKKAAKELREYLSPYPKEYNDIKICF